MDKPNELAPFQEDFIGATTRAFRRVARQLRAENKRWGLPLLVIEPKKKRAAKKSVVRVKRTSVKA